MTWPTDHPFWSYRLAKFEMAQERRGLGRLKFATFERNLHRNLEALSASLSSPDAIFRNINAGRVRLRPKSAELVPRNEAAKSFVRIPERPLDHAIDSLSVRVMIESEPAFATSEVTWLRAYGQTLETLLIDACRANRLELRGSPPAINARGRRLFEFWAPAYSRFRGDALAAARGALTSGSKRCYLIALDLASYYDNIDPKFLLTDAFVSDLEQRSRINGLAFNASDYVQATSGLLKAFESFRAKIQRVVGAAPNTGIPIGCLTSRMIANLALCRMDREVSQKPAVRFYARYVDDIILVVEPDGADISAAIEVLARCLPVDRNRSTDERIVLDEGVLKRLGSSFVVQKTKLRIFDLEGELGLEYLDAISAEMSKASSDRRRFLEPGDGEADRTVAASNTSEPIRTLREADGLSLRRLAANSVCSKVVTSAAMLTHTEAAAYSREHLGRTARLATDWSRWVEMVDVALYVLAASLTAGDAATSNEVISGLLSRAAGLRGDVALTVNWGARALDGGRASRLIERWVVAQLRETLAASLPSETNSSNVINEVYDGALRGNSIRLLERDKVVVAAKKLARADLRLVDRETDVSLGVLYPSRDAKMLQKLDAQLVHEIEYTQRKTQIESFREVCAGNNDRIYSKVHPLDLLLTHRPPTYTDILLRWLRADTGLAGLVDVINAVRGTRYASLPMSEEGGVVTVDASDEVIVGPSGVGTTRVILGNLCTEDSWWKDSLSSPALTRERQRRFSRVFNKALYAARRAARKGRPSLLVLPELSLPQRWLREVLRHLSWKAPYLSLIAGLEYRNVGAKVFNEAVCFVPRTFAAAAAWVWTKNRPAHAEGPLLKDNGFSFGRRSRKQRFTVMSTEHGKFIPLICSELLEVDSRAELLGRVDVVLVPAWNRDQTSFEYALQATSLDLHSFVAVANNGVYSDCRIRGPYDTVWRRDACRLSARGENEIVLADLPIDHLRDYRRDPTAYELKIATWAKKRRKHPDKAPWPSWKPAPPK